MIEVSFLIPLRGRQNQIDNCLTNIEICYGNYEYEVLFAYQDDDTLFKRGQLINLVAKKAKGNVFVIQDVDTRHLRRINLNKIREGCVGFSKRETVFDIENGRIKKTGKYLSAGSGSLVIVTKQKFFDSHGFSNVYFGWGYEDISFAQCRANLSYLKGILGHAYHSPNKSKENLAKNYLLNRSYFSFERIYNNFITDSAVHTMANEREQNNSGQKNITYYFSNIRVTSDFGQKDWYQKQIDIEKRL